MYDYLCPLSKSQDFCAASDKLTEIVRLNLILVQKEVHALAGRRIKQKEALAMAQVDRAAAFPTKAETYGQKIYNFGKVVILHGGEAKIKTELSVTDLLIKGYKEDFGVALYHAFSEAEDKEGFLPTDRQIRNVYDTGSAGHNVPPTTTKSKRRFTVRVRVQVQVPYDHNIII